MTNIFQLLICQYLLSNVLLVDNSCSIDPIAELENPKKYNESLTLIIGPMFAGKTTRLQKMVNNYKDSGDRVLVLSHSKYDNRYEEGFICSHDGVKMRSSPVKDLNTAKDMIKEYDVISIDEGQFFEDLVENVIYFLEEGKRVIVAGLDMDFKKNKFGHILDLDIYTDNIERLRADCMRCGEPGIGKAVYSYRIAGGVDVIEVGGSDKYIAVCNDCYEEYERGKLK